MQIRPLRTYNLPDLSDHVIHFTGRTGKRTEVDEKILNMSDQQRLAEIVLGPRVQAFQTFGAQQPVTCFTESTRPAITRLLADGRYTPCGIAFSKQHIFTSGGGPVFYVRGDEWVNFPTELRSRAVRFWPGAIADEGEYLGDALTIPSEWLHEREWRVLGDVQFEWSDIAFLITPDPGWQPFYADYAASVWGDGYGAALANIPCVALAANGDIIQDTHGIWH